MAFPYARSKPRRSLLSLEFAIVSRAGCGRCCVLLRSQLQPERLPSGILGVNQRQSRNSRRDLSAAVEATRTIHPLPSANIYISGLVNPMMPACYGHQNTIDPRADRGNLRRADLLETVQKSFSGKAKTSYKPCSA